jgi:hypothetical protein
MTASTGTIQSGRSSVGSRIDRLTEQVKTLRTRASTGNLDRWLLIVGGVLMPLGVLLIILGWVGASRTPLPFEQNDYLISGGILGLALTVAGGFTYFAYWQTVRIRDSREQSKAMTDAMARLEALLSGSGVAVATGPSSAVTQAFVATANGSIFHRRDCPAVGGRDDLHPVAATATDLRPCRICSPLDEA